MAFEEELAMPSWLEYLLHRIFTSPHKGVNESELNPELKSWIMGSEKEERHLV